ncbi:hypothetical protein ACTQ4E_09485 [Lawsonibacter sp. LCP25S3_G6]|uniref:hypothetical protein n=1 Tax=unclassified Lawsonibacter TaxID=2617946 RepID=UPI003F9C9D01
MFTSTALALASSSILGLLNSVYAFLAASCFVPFVGGVLWKRGNATGAAAASIAGVVTVVVTNLGVVLPGSGIIPGAILPIIPSAIVYVIVSLCTKAPAAQEV